MGVNNLWDLLAPVGRRVSVETLSGKRLAIDASIWMVQFMKAMRDEKGEMVRNAHLLGFFRRICKLLFLRTKPVFVFDGGTPALKRRTVVARRRQRENAQAKFRKTAEKLFLNHLKAMRLNNLAESLKDQKKTSNSKGKEVMLDPPHRLEKNVAALDGETQKMVDEMLAASILAEECGGLNDNASAPAANHGSASSFVPRDSNACSSASTSTSAAPFAMEDETDEDDEEMIMPVTDGNVDPAVLASLPPSMQLDLLVQMRERLMAENRQKYQRVKKAPQKFSELQIEAYLKTVAFRREIDEVQRAAAGKGTGGVQTSRIASETNREFIFSSSFSGDKQLLAFTGAEKCPEQQQKTEKRESSLNILNVIAASTNSNIEAEHVADEAVHTYIDERGQKRVSRRRAMGIQMTRDLQRNIDLMKELEQERLTATSEADSRSKLEGTNGASENLFCEAQSPEDLRECNSGIHNSTEKSLLETETHENASKTESCIDISFVDDGLNSSLDGDDEFFAHLVAGNPVTTCSDDNSASDFEWEDGTAAAAPEALTDVKNLRANSPDPTDGMRNESDVEWEDGSDIGHQNLETTSFHVNNNNKFNVEGKEEITGFHAVSKGSAEEEAALQEALRRSLEDQRGGMSSNVSWDVERSNPSCNRLQSGSFKVFKENNSSRPSVIESNQSSVMAVTDADAPSTSDVHSISTPGADIARRALANAGGTEKSLPLQNAETSMENAQISNLTKLAGTNDDAPCSSDLQSTSASGTENARPGLANPGGNEKKWPLQEAKTSLENAEISDMKIGSSVQSLMVGGYSSDSMPISCGTDKINQSLGPTKSDLSTEQASSVLEVQTLHADVKSTTGDDAYFGRGPGRDNDVQTSASIDIDDSDDLLGASLEEELSVLDRQYKDLEDEQRKLERNAASVNSEMFVECQELLQMFGLPYIIAPMEAEAQCAFLEAANLVDGVVTDDSDVFLFGAQCVYKNIFDDRKYVETYLLKDMERELGLNREKLIRMALLLGSDYTEGISGIGIVNAIEVVNAFPEEDGLSKFREWVESPDPTILGKAGLQSGSRSKKDGSETSMSGTSNSECNMEGLPAADYASQANQDDESVKIRQTFMDKHRNVSKNWHIPASFPSAAVISAYKAPQVDKSAEPFAWGKPDIFSLRRLCWEKFAWANQKADELLLPVLKEYNKHETQLRLEAYYSFDEKFAKIRSKRIQKAVKGITGKRSSANINDLQEFPQKVTNRGASSHANSNSQKSDNVGGTKKSSKRLKTTKRNAKEGGSPQLSIDLEEKRADEPGSGRVKRKRGGKAFSRGGRKESSDSELDDTIPIDYSNEHEPALQTKRVMLPENVRRSKRVRRATSYLEINEESDDLIDSQDKPDDCETVKQKSPKFSDVEKDDAIDACRAQKGASGDPIPVSGLSAEYLGRGGGFYTDEDEAEKESDRAGSMQIDGAGVDTDNQYLQMGGGFCQDEEDQVGVGPSSGAVVDIPVSSDKEEVCKIAGEQGCGAAQSSLHVEDNTQGLQNNLSVSKLNSGEQHEPIDGSVAKTMGDAAPATVSAFSAIPFLRKKRRKT